MSLMALTASTLISHIFMFLMLSSVVRDRTASFDFISSSVTVSVFFHLLF